MSTYAVQWKTGKRTFIEAEDRRITHGHTVFTQRPGLAVVIALCSTYRMVWLVSGSEESSDE